MERKEILREFVRSEKETLENLQRIVLKAKPHVWIDEKTKQIRISNKGYLLAQKVCLSLIGAYFGSELGLLNKPSLNVSDLTKILHVPGRALSNPLGGLIKKHFISVEEKEYTIVPYHIEEILDEINKIEEGGEQTKRQIVKRKKQKSSKNAEKETILRKFSEEGYKKLLKDSTLGEGDLKKIFDFEEKELRIIFPISTLNKSISKKQHLSALLYLMGFKYCYGLKEISSSELRKKLEELGIDSLVNLSTNLKSFRNEIIHKKGLKGSTNTFYKITLPGELHAIKELKDLIHENE